MSAFHFSPRPNRANEIQWQEWGTPAFAAAKEQAKPVLLAISAVWCHWCHVMDETTYSDSGVIRLINERFVPVRVDNDQRPDVNARYNMGGWPTTALLSPDGEILFGGTYMPPDTMRQVLQQVDGFHGNPENRLALVKRVQEIKAARAARALTPQGSELDGATAPTVLALIAADFDERYGGFGSDQKFPHVPVLHFLLDDWARTRDARAENMAQKTLHAMAEGGMYDHVLGGFFRYSTTPDFSVPHYEKMLEDLGGLLWACARAAAMFADGKLGAVAVDVKRYLDDHLWNANWRGYGGSQDADEQYYSLDADARARLHAPYVDRTIYTAWNAQAACALLVGAPLLGSLADVAAWHERGLEIVQALWTQSRSAGLMCRYFDGAPHVRGLLVDQVWMSRALLCAFSVSGDSAWLERARDLLGQADVLYDPQAETYLDRIADVSDPGKVADPSAPFEENSLLARVLLDYATFSGEMQYAERAKAMLKRYAQHYESYGLFAASYASAVLDALDPPVDVHIVGNPAAAETCALRGTALGIAVPPLRVDPIDPGTEGARLERLGYDAQPAAAYLCRANSCFARVTEGAELRRRLADEPSRRSASLANKS